MAMGKQAGKGRWWGLYFWFEEMKPLYHEGHDENTDAADHSQDAEDKGMHALRSSDHTQQEKYCKTFSQLAYDAVERRRPHHKHSPSAWWIP